jgi:hypothetical protein
MRVFGRELTKTFRSRGVTAEEAASELSLPGEVVARWAEGKDLPSESDARSLDEYLTARGAIQNLAIELRSAPDRTRHGSAPVLPPGPPVHTLLQIFESAARALRSCLTLDAGGKPQGWPSDLRQLSARPTASSTAYGIKTLLLLEEGLAPDLVPVAESLRQMDPRGRGYAAQAQSRPRPEVTAVVVDALHRVTGTANFDAQFAMMERDLGDFEKCRPFILTTMLETSVQLRPEAKLTDTLIESLLAARRPYDELLLWPEKAEPLLIDPAPSVAHTARAVRALARTQAVRPSDQVQEALDQAAAWLAGRRHLRNAYEVVDRPLDGGVEQVFIRHFTAAWVVKALISAGIPATHPSVSSAVARIWNSYGGDTAGLWAWDNGDLPIWMTFDAVEALRLANLAIPAPATVGIGRTGG